MTLGFIGTRRGLTKVQYDALFVLVQALHLEHSFTQAKHGGAEGADTDFDNICDRHSITRLILPGPDTDTSGFIHGSFLLAEPEGNLKRNRTIVACSSIMIGCPYEMVEQNRGGTWYTIRFAQKHQCPIYIVYPDGSISKEGG